MKIYPMDPIVSDSEQERGERRILVVEDKRGLAIQHMHFGNQVDAPSSRRNKCGDSPGALQRRLKIANSRGAPAFGTAIGDQHRIFGKHRDQRVEIAVGRGLGERRTVWRIVAAQNTRVSPSLF